MLSGRYTKLFIPPIPPTKGRDDVARRVTQISIQIMMEVRVVFVFIHILSIAKVLTIAPTLHDHLGTGPQPVGRET